MKDLLYELRIEDDDDEVFAISLVESPAIESDFVYFDKEVIQFAKVDTEQKMLLGPILIPDKKILRVDGAGQPYHVFFTKETVKKLAQNYLMKKYTDKATIEHDKSVKGVHLVESWVKDGKLDKSNNYGLNLAEGTWVGMFKITDDKIWKDYVKTGKVKGFSVEALLEHKLVKASIINLEKDVEDLSENEVEVLLSQIKSLILEQKGLELEVGVPHYTKDGKLYEGPYHKNEEGRLMTGEVHSEVSRYLYHKEELEAIPSITSTYPGEKAKDIVAPALLD